MKAPQDQPIALHRRARAVAILTVLIAVGLLCAGMLIRRTVLRQVTQKAQQLIRDSEFQLSWQNADLTLAGRLVLQGVSLSVGPAPPILTIAEVSVQPDLAALLRGTKRAYRIELQAPAVRIALERGRPETWLRLRAVIRRNRQAQVDEEGEQGKGLAKRVDQVSVTGGQVRLREIGTGPLADQEFALDGIVADIDLGQPAAHLRGAFAGVAGQGALQADLLLQDRQPMAAEVRATPPLLVPSLPTLPGIEARIAGAAWSKTGPELRGVDVAGPGEVRAHVERVAWLPQEGHKAVKLTGISASGQGVEVHVGSATVQAATTTDLAHPLAWQRLEVDRPVLTLPLAAPILASLPEIRRKAEAMAAMRTPLEPMAGADEDEEELDALASAPPPPAHGHARPAVRWMADLKAVHAKILSFHDALERLWPLAHVPDDLVVQVQGAEVTLVGAAGKVLLGLREGRLDWSKTTTLGRPLHIGARIVDAVGPWGRIGAQWRRDPQSRAHSVDLHFSGAGVAQLLAARVHGMGIGAGADLDVYATARVPDGDQLDVEGRVDIDHMGIDWWRLADRPIADFRMLAPFSLSVRSHPDSLSLRAPDIDLSGARLAAELDVAHIDRNPKVRAWLEAPMQDCATMLHAVPPSLLPTVGRIEAHGAMGWHAGVAVTLPMVGAVDVDLALADTPCTVDKLGTIDLSEFLRADWDRPVNENGVLLDDVHIGPGSGSWTPLTQMPEYVYYAMWATEDSFMRHRGLSESLIEKALGIDLTTGRFTYGGSTITQQLVKNLFLKRTKALSRKFEEMLIVWQMERVLSKQRILEIYVNGVEFGPKVYGITRAAWAFFSKTPGELLPKEGVYLAIIKPSPRSGYGTMRVNGWGEWYEEKTTKYMDKLLRDGSISQEAYDADLPFKPVFHPPGK